MAMNEPTPDEKLPPGTVSGKWFIPALFIGLLLFTFFMIYGTRALAQGMAPSLRRRGIEAQKEELRKERKAAESRVPASAPLGIGSSESGDK